MPPTPTPAEEEARRKAALGQVREAIRGVVGQAYSEAAVRARVEDPVKVFLLEDKPRSDDKEEERHATYRDVRLDWKKPETEQQFKAWRDEMSARLESRLIEAGVTATEAKRRVAALNVEIKSQIDASTTAVGMTGATADNDPLKIYQSVLAKAPDILGLTDTDRAFDAMEGSGDDDWAKAVKERARLSEMARSMKNKDPISGQPVGLYGAMRPYEVTSEQKLMDAAKGFLNKAETDKLISFKSPQEKANQQYALGLLYVSFATETSGNDIAHGIGGAIKGVLPTTAAAVRDAFKEGGNKIDWADPKWKDVKEAVVAGGQSLGQDIEQIVKALPIRVGSDVRVSKCNSMWQALVYPETNDPLSGRPLTKEQIAGMPPVMEAEIRAQKQARGVRAGANPDELTMRDVVHYLKPEIGQNLATMITGSHNRSGGQKDQQAYTWSYHEPNKYSFWSAIGAPSRDELMKNPSAKFMSQFGRDTPSHKPERDYDPDYVRRAEQAATDRFGKFVFASNAPNYIDPPHRGRGEGSRAAYS